MNKFEKWDPKGIICLNFGMKKATRRLRVQGQWYRGDMKIRV